MFKKILVERMQENEVAQAASIWKEQFEFFNEDHDICEHYKNSGIVEGFISSHVENGDCLVAKVGGEIVGYFSFDVIRYNNVKSAVIPFLGNSSIPENRDYIYAALYKRFSDIITKKAVRSHYISISCNDNVVKEELLSFGFGAYSADESKDSDTDIASPIFLARDSISIDELDCILKKSCMLVSNVIKE